MVQIERSQSKRPSLTIVMPCYNEEGVLIKSIPVVLHQLELLIEGNKITNESQILLVDDGSKDRTWLEIESLAEQYHMIKGLKLARNFGHQNAVYAGMMFVLHTLKSEACISMDCDLQDDPAIIPLMLEEYLNGKDIVYGVRNSRQKDSLAKKFFARRYYQLLQFLKIDIIQDHADYRLLSNTALNALSNFKESSLFLRGIVPLIGYRSSIVHYERDKRISGYSKYDIPRMVRLAINGICSFSSAPLIFILWLGIVVSMLAMGLGVWALGVKLLSGEAISGWASIVVPMYFLGGIQLFTLGVMGIYLSKIFDEVKNRPKYIIEREL